MYNELFESIIRTSGENTDYLYDFDDRADNFWAPVPAIEQMFEDIYFECNIKPLFERILIEAGLTGINGAGNRVTPVIEIGKTNKDSQNPRQGKRNKDSKNKGDELQNGQNPGIKKKTLSNSLGAIYNKEGKIINNDDHKISELV